MSNNRRKDSKFYLYSPQKKGSDKGNSLLVANHLYQGDRSTITLKDLLVFLEEKNIDPSAISLDRGYMAKVKMF